MNYDKMIGRYSVIDTDLVYDDDGTPAPPFKDLSNAASACIPRCSRSSPTIKRLLPLDSPVWMRRSSSAKEVLDVRSELVAAGLLTIDYDTQTAFLPAEPIV